jgi:hypothetical protein
MLNLILYSDQLSIVVTVVRCFTWVLLISGPQVKDEYATPCQTIIDCLIVMSVHLKESCDENRNALTKERNHFREEVKQWKDIFVVTAAVGTASFDLATISKLLSRHQPAPGSRIHVAAKKWLESSFYNDGAVNIQCAEAFACGLFVAAFTASSALNLVVINTFMQVVSRVDDILPQSLQYLHACLEVYAENECSKFRRHFHIYS